MDIIYSIEEVENPLFRFGSVIKYAINSKGIYYQFEEETVKEMKWGDVDFFSFSGERICFWGRATSLGHTKEEKFEIKCEITPKLLSTIRQYVKYEIEGMYEKIPFHLECLCDWGAGVVLGDEFFIEYKNELQKMLVILRTKGLDAAYERAAQLSYEYSQKYHIDADTELKNLLRVMCVDRTRNTAMQKARADYAKWKMLESVNQQIKEAENKSLGFGIITNSAADAALYSYMDYRNKKADMNRAFNQLEAIDQVYSEYCTGLKTGYEDIFDCVLKAYFVSLEHYVEFQQSTEMIDEVYKYLVNHVDEHRAYKQLLACMEYYKSNGIWLGRHCPGGGYTEMIETRSILNTSNYAGGIPFPLYRVKDFPSFGKVPSLRVEKMIYKKIQEEKREQYWAEHQDEKNKLEKEKSVLIEKKQQLINQIKSAEEQIQALDQSKANELPIDIEIRNQQALIDDLRVQIKNAGLFAGKRKKELKKRIKSCENPKLQEKVAKADEDRRHYLADIDKKVMAAKTELVRLQESKDIENADKRLAEIDEEFMKNR